MSRDNSVIPPTRESRMLRERRLELGLSQHEIAVECSMTIQQYQRYEYGVRSLTKIRMGTGLKICAVLELDPYDLLFPDSI